MAEHLRPRIEALNPTGSASGFGQKIELEQGAVAEKVRRNRLFVAYSPPRKN